MIRREKFLFEDKESLPQYWKIYFSMSKPGNEYNILYEDEDPNDTGETLIMSDTEYEYYTNEPFFQKIKQGDEVLSVGYGIGLIIPEVKRRKAKLTVLEKYQEVLDLEENLDPDVEILIGDVNEIHFTKMFENRKFDVIFSDTSETNKRHEELKQFLKPGGQLILWKHLVPNLNWINVYGKSGSS